MSKRVFRPETIPTEQQEVNSPDFSDDSIIIDNNPFIMRGRMVAGINAGVWSPVNLTPYKYDENVNGGWTDSTLYDQVSSIGSDATVGVVTASKFYDDSAHTYVQFVKELTINLNGEDVVNAPTTGVDVWFRWMPPAAFKKYTLNEGNKITGVTTSSYNCPRETPCGSWQKPPPHSPQYSTDDYWEPTDWQFIGTRYEVSFNVTVPMPPNFNEWIGIWRSKQSSGTPININDASSVEFYINQNFPDVWFQVLVSGHSTWKPDKYNYRWIGNTDEYVEADFVDNSTWNAYRQYWAVQNGTYTWSSNTITVTSSGHGHSIGDSVYLNFTSGGAIGNGDAFRIVNVPNANTFTVDFDGSGTSGNVTISLIKVGDKFVSHNDDGSVWNYYAIGYLPWNPHYGKTLVDYGSPDYSIFENTYRRQRTTFGDVAIFSPKRWRKWAELT